MKADFVRSIIEANFTPSTLRFLVESMPRRLLEVIEKASNVAKY